jgi:hypothetical protein
MAAIQKIGRTDILYHQKINNNYVLKSTTDNVHSAVDS